MTLKNILLLLVALGTAAMTAFLANNWINSERASLMAMTPTAQTIAPVAHVLIIKDNLKAGNFVRAENLKWLSWPEDGVSEQYIVQGTRKIEDFVGAVVRNGVTPGQPMTDSLVVHPGERGFLAAVLGIGSRAVTVPVNATSGIAGFIFPGDRVDLILTSRFNSQDAEGKTLNRFVTKTLLSGIRVLAIDQKTESVDGEVSPAKTVTMEVTPKQAEKIAIGMAMGSLSLSLQSLARDETNIEGSATLKPETKKGRGFTLDTDVNALVAGLSRPVAKKVLIVHILRGNEAEQARF